MASVSYTHLDVYKRQVINHYNQSKSATEMLLKIINEETTKQLYIGDDSINDYIFDYETLKAVSYTHL